MAVKIIDMLKHIWVPLLVLGTGGTAGLIREFLKDAFNHSPLSRIGALFALTSLRRLSRRGWDGLAGNGRAQPDGRYLAVRILRGSG